jgi:hypothetical protein
MSRFRMIEQSQTVYVPSATCPPPSPTPRSPSVRLPVDACDAHCHVFGTPQCLPHAVKRSFTPAKRQTNNSQRFTASWGSHEPSSSVPRVTAVTTPVYSMHFATRTTGEFSRGPWRSAPFRADSLDGGQKLHSDNAYVSERSSSGRAQSECMSNMPRGSKFVQAAVSHAPVSLAQHKARNAQKQALNASNQSIDHEGEH